MKTIVLKQPGQFITEDRDEPDQPGAGEAIVRVERIGICGTDQHAFRGTHPIVTYPRVLGHELGVRLVDVGGHGTVTCGLRPGDSCAVEPYLHCGHCVACRAGKTNCCTQLAVLGVHVDGGMCKYLKVPAAKLHKSSLLSVDQLALVETLGIGAHAVQRADVQPGENVMVIGAGPIGLGAIQFAQAAGARVIVLDVNEHRLRFAHEKLPGIKTIRSVAPDLSNLKDMTDNQLPTAVFDATGNAASMTTAFGYVAAGGRLVFVGLIKADITFSDADLHRKEMSLLASRNAPSSEFPRIISMIESGQIDTTPWITHRSSFDEFAEQFPSWLDPATQVVKAMIAV